MHHYVPWYGLDGRPISDLEAGVLLADLDARRVSYTALPTADGGVIVVSTMFSVTPATTRSDGQPALWETIVVGDTGSERVERHTSRQDAERQHDAIVADIRSRHGLSGPPDSRAGKTRQPRSETPAYAAPR